MIACLSALSCQLSLVAIVAPLESCNSKTGSAKTPVSGREGPIARAMTCFDSVPVTMNPPIETLSSIPTFTRVEILPSWTGKNGVGAGVGVGEGEAVGLGEGVGDDPGNVLLQ